MSTSSVGVVAKDQWVELTLPDILDAGIPPYPKGELPEFTQAAVASWRMGDYGAAMWLYWDPDDLGLPITHEIEVARWQDGRWRPLGDTAIAPAHRGYSLGAPTRRSSGPRQLKSCWRTQRYGCWGEWRRMIGSSERWLRASSSDRCAPTRNLIASSSESKSPRSQP